MLVDPDLVIRALGLPAGTTVETEPIGGSVERVSLCLPGGARQVVAVRRNADPEGATNHAAVMEALTNRGFPYAPRLLANAGDAAIEQWVEGATALGVLPPRGSCEAAIDALAALHGLPLRERLDWDRSPADLFRPEEVPLYRLGFAAHEREAAREPLARARMALLESPFGFAHRDATAANVVLAPGIAWLTDFSRAGHGPQLFDVAAFLLTAGVEAAERRALAERYASARGLASTATAGLVDLLGISWGIEELLRLPRRLIEALGDDAATEALKTAAARIDRGLRSPAGDHPAARAIRAALWPS